MSEVCAEVQKFGDGQEPELWFKSSLEAMLVCEPKPLMVMVDVSTFCIY
jgi:hypothetical protein